MYKYTKTESGQFNPQNQDGSGNNIIRKTPNKSELRTYLKNMIFFDNLGNDSTGRNKGCYIYEVYNFICKNYFYEYFQEGPIDIIMDGVALYRFTMIMELFDTLTDQQIDSILRKNNVYPEFVYGIKSSDGIENYFYYGYTDVLQIDKLNDVVIFECYKSELLDLADQNKSLSGICREIVFKESDEYMIRELDHFDYSIYKILNNKFVYDIALNIPFN
jgi:hypothetical protein